MICSRLSSVIFGVPCLLYVLSLLFFDCDLG